MTSKSLRAIDLFCEIGNLNDSLENLYEDEQSTREYCLKKRGRAHARFCKLMSEITLQEYLGGRWRGVPMERRMKQWDEMTATVRNASYLPRAEENNR